MVDPLDGTINFLAGIPLWCVSISLWLNGSLQVGVVIDTHGNMFSAIKDKGAFLNGQLMKANSAKSIEQSCLACDWPKNPKLRPVVQNTFFALMQQSKDVVIFAVPPWLLVT